jgi:hypothetical protein
MDRFRRAVVLAGLAGLPWLSGCARYQIGNQSLYPAHIHTVYVSMFENSSFRRNLGERLTEAVQKEIELKTPYKVVSDRAAADSVLIGRLTNDNKYVLVPSPNGGPRESQVVFQVKVNWQDRTGKAIRDAAPIPWEASAVLVSGNSTLIPEIGQSTATAQQQAIQRVAVQIVALMEAPW